MNVQNYDEKTKTIMTETLEIGSYKNLLVWQKGIVLMKSIYQMTQTFPSEEKFGLVSQMRRAAVSIPSNIAEGQARHTTGEFIQFISHAEGSVVELDTQVIITSELGYCKKQELEDIIKLILKLRLMLSSLRIKLSQKQKK